MSSTATKKKSLANAIPRITGSWVLTVSDNPQLFVLRSIDISFQKQDETPNRIFGSVSSSPPNQTAYAIENGKVSQNLGVTEVTFEVTMADIVYTFTGQVEGPVMKSGSISCSPVGSTSLPETEEGSWSAKAQIFLDEEEEKRSSRHAKRSSR